jgi:hypothetical protein
MRWPEENDYSSYVEHSASRLVHPALAGVEFVPDPLDGLPQHNGSGEFAVVFRMRDAVCGEFGLKCFLHDVKGRDVRYASIQQAIKGMSRTDSLVAFEYLPEAIRAKGGRLVPAVRMEWVQGAHLDTYIEEHVDDSRALQSLATQLRQTVVNLRRQDAAHGDLQHGNILVLRNGRIKLVDLDGMYVPQLAGERRFEAGHPSYRHPGADPSRFDATIDDFSAWLIFLSLHALAKEPSLWQMRSGRDDQLLLSADDLAAPKDSEMVQHLAGSSDPALRHIGLTLGRFLSLPATKVPSFRDEWPLNPLFPPPWMGGPAPDWAQSRPKAPDPFVPISLPQVPPKSPPRRKRATTQTSGQRRTEPVASGWTGGSAPDWAQPKSPAAAQSGYVSLPDIAPTNSGQHKPRTTRPTTGSNSRPVRSSPPAAGKNHAAPPVVDVHRTRDPSPLVAAIGVIAVVVLVILLALIHVI